MNKKVVFSLLLVSIITTIIISSVSAQSTCNDDNTILYLTSSTNAHASTSSSSGYSNRICYDSLFGSTLTGGQRTCTSTNKLLRLSGSTNAHAETSSSTTTGYSDACYGNIICTTRSLQACASDEVEVVRLYSQTNSHLAMPGSGAGTIAVCCKLRGEITDAHWENLLGQEITGADQGDTVIMVVPGTDLAGQEINYTVEKQGTTWVFFTTWTGISSYSGGASRKIRMDEEGTFRFRARIPGQSQEKISGNLIVGPARNTPPTTAIRAPIDMGIYFLNQTLNFSESTSDPDDNDLTYEWVYGDGQKSTSKNPQYRYTTPGQKVVLLRVTDSRGGVAEAKADILIINSSYSLSYISSPSYKQLIAGLDVQLDATRSYAVEVTYNPLVIRCIAGTCPNTTADGVYEVEDTPQPITGINYAWVLSDGYTRSGNSTEAGLLQYRFTTLGIKSATMKVTSPQGQNATTWTNFTLYPSGGASLCSTTANSATWTNEEGSSSSMNDCYRAGSTPSMCCPTGYTCTQQGTNYKCLPGGISSCSDYTTQTSCSNYDPSVAVESVRAASNGEIVCGDVIRQYEENGRFYKETAGNCRCEWQSSTCRSAYDTLKECADGSCTPEIVGSCSTTVSLSQDLCSSPQKIRVYSVDSTWTGSAESTPTSCSDTTLEKSCVDFTQIKLPFFSLIQTLITIALIIGFYTLSRRKK